jgi:hypothetical protein
VGTWASATWAIRFYERHGSGRSHRLRSGPAVVASPIALENVSLARDNVPNASFETLTVIQPTPQTRQSGEKGFMGSREMGGSDWVTFQARSLEGRMNCIFDISSGAPTIIATNGDGL